MLKEYKINIAPTIPERTRLNSFESIFLTVSNLNNDIIKSTYRSINEASITWQ